MTRSVTLVVADLKGSTALAERLDAETLRALLTRYFDEMRRIHERRGGTVAKIIGDALVVVFDASADLAAAPERAVVAVLEAREALHALNDGFENTWGVRLEVRTGVASGEVPEAHAGHDADAALLAGDVMAAAETLESQSPVAEALLDARTVALLGDRAEVVSVGEVARKDGLGTLPAWRLLRAGADGRDGVHEAPARIDRPRACPACGASNGADARRCARCGSPLAAGDMARESRRTVTIVFANPAPATADGSAAGAAAVQRAMARYVDLARPVLERHGGTVEKFIGDAVMAVFGLTVRHEDDAVRALRAATEIRDAIGSLNEALASEVGLRITGGIGVYTGPVVAGDAAAGERLVTGDAVNVAARLQQTAGSGEIVVGELTRRLAGDTARFESMEPLRLKGKAEAVEAHRLLGMATATVTMRRHQLPLVGRDAELATLRDALARVRRSGRAERVTLVGEAGVGKSRLTHELVAEVEPRGRVVRGNCLAYGDGITFWPFLRIIQDAANIEDDDDATTARQRITSAADGDAAVADRLAALAGLDATPFAVPELVWAMRRLLEHLAAAGPVLAVVDDVHWAEATLLDALDELGRTVRAPVLLLCTARPSMVDEHPAFLGGAVSVQLDPLDSDACERFLRLLLGGEASSAGGAAGQADERVIRHIVEAAGGNPLFLEQLLSMLTDEGRLRQEQGRWRLLGGTAALDIPASIEALLAARLDLLPAPERRVIEPAAVIGRRFPQEAVEHVVDVATRPAVGPSLAVLAERELVARTDAEDPVFRFHHQLIREATYQGLLKESRAIFHERFVAWADRVNAALERTTEFEEIQGYHLEQAYRYWLELGPADEHVVALGEDAARRLSAAGQRALGRGDMAAAANLLSRAAALLPDGHPSAPRVLLGAGAALHETGAFDQALDSYDAAAVAARSLGDTAGAKAAELEGLRLRYLIGRTDDPVAVEYEVARAIDHLQSLGDADALSRAWQLRLNLDIAACRWAAAQQAAGQVIELAGRAGNATLEVRTMPLLAFLAQKGPMPVEEAAAVCDGILERVSFDRRSSALTQLESAMLAAMATDVGRARELCADTRAALMELGWEMQAALVSLSSGPIELLAGDAVRAEAELRGDYEALHRMGERNFVTLTAALLAEAVYRQHRFDEADELVRFSREQAAPDDLAVHIVAGSVAGKLAARRGDLPAGRALMAEALALIDGTDDPVGQADARLDLAEVLYLSGETARAVEAAREARARYATKGSRAGVERADRVCALLAVGADPLGPAQPHDPASRDPGSGQVPPAGLR